MGRWLACWMGLLVALPLVAQEAADSDRARLAKWHYHKGVDLMRTERWDASAEEFKTALSHDPLMAIAHYNLGQCRMAQKRYVEAVAAYKGAREAVLSQGNLSEKERGQRERERIDEINELKESLQRLTSIEARQGPMIQQRNAIEERIRLLENLRFSNSAAIEPPAEFSLALGSAYFRQEKFEDAEREYKGAVRVNPKLGAAHNNLAAIYLITGRYDQAEVAVKAAEKSGFPVSPRLKEDLKKAKSK